MSDNNNLDLSTIAGSGPNSQKTKELHKGIIEDTAKAIDGEKPAASDEKSQEPAKPAKSNEFSLPEGYDPMFDPKVKQHRDSLMSQVTSLQNQLKEKGEELTKVGSTLEEIKAIQDKERQKELSDTEKLNEQFGQLADQNKALLQKLADMESKQADSEFQTAKSKILQESGIPVDYHKFIGADKKDIVSFQQSVSEAQEVFKDVIKKSQVPEQMKTQTIGTPNPPAADSTVQKAATQAAPDGNQHRSILERLTPEQAQSVNLETLKDILKSSPKMSETLKKALSR